MENTEEKIKIIKTIENYLINLGIPERAANIVTLCLLLLVLSIPLYGLYLKFHKKPCSGEFSKITVYSASIAAMSYPESANPCVDDITVYEAPKAVDIRE